MVKLILLLLRIINSNSKNILESYSKHGSPSGTLKSMGAVDVLELGY